MSFLDNEIQEILTAFDDWGSAKRLARRRNNFRQMIEHVLRFKNKKQYGVGIVETGTAWVEDSWEGQGQSTIIWNWLVEQIMKRREYSEFDVVSIDLRAEAADYSSKQTKHVTYFTGDSIQQLSTEENDLGPATALLYLDSYDWSPELNMEAGFHALCELTAIYASLPSGCMIAVDDRHGDMKGKHWMVEHFFMKLNVEPVFKNHQIAWIKP